MTQPVGAWPTEQSAAKQDRIVGVVWPGPGSPAEFQEVARFIPEGVKMHIVGAGPESEEQADITLEHVLSLAEPPLIEDGAKRLLPFGVEAVGYACTSTSFARGVGGDQDITDRIRAATGLPATTISTAMVAALRHLGVRRVALLAPYIAAINRRLRIFLEASGFSVVHMVGLNKLRDIECIRPETIFDTVVTEVDCVEAECVFISCTGMATASILDRMEAATGKPVITANQATIWDLLRVAGASQTVPKLGSLFAT